MHRRPIHTRQTFLSTNFLRRQRNANTSTKTTPHAPTHDPSDSAYTDYAAQNLNPYGDLDDPDTDPSSASGIRRAYMLDLAGRATSSSHLEDPKHEPSDTACVERGGCTRWLSICNASWKSRTRLFHRVGCGFPASGLVMAVLRDHRFLSGRTGLEGCLVEGGVRED